MSFETIIRPYTVGDISPPRVVISSGNGTGPSVITLNIGQKGSPKIVTLSTNASASYYSVNRPFEMKKTNPDSSFKVPSGSFSVAPGTFSPPPGSFTPGGPW